MTTGSTVLQLLRDGSSTSAKDRRRAARAALAKMKGDRNWFAEVDDSALDFLATEVSEQMMQELARRWLVRAMGYPTPLELAALSEQLHLEAAVAALDAI